MIRNIKLALLMVRKLKERKAKIRKSLYTHTGTHLGEENRKRVMFTTLYRATGILHNRQNDGLARVLISINIIRLKMFLFIWLIN